MRASPLRINLRGEVDPGESVSSLRFLDVYRVIAYYGNPLTPDMGIVGQYPPEEVVRRLKAQADVYRPLSPDREIIPAIDLVYAVAQLDPGPDGQYLLRMGDGLVQDWIRITKEEGILLFLDIQIGRSTVEAEVSRVLPFLSEEHVHLALDPEFAWGSTETPGVDIGHLDGADVNRAIDLVDQYVAREKARQEGLSRASVFARDADEPRLDPIVRFGGCRDRRGWVRCAPRRSSRNGRWSWNKAPSSALELSCSMNRTRLREDCCQRRM